MICEYCNTKNDEKANYCKECGVNLQYKSFDNFVSSLIKVNINFDGVPFDIILKEQTKLLDNLPNLVWIKDLKGEYIYGNILYAKVNDLKQENIPGKTDYDLFNSELADKYRNDDLIVINSKQVLIIEEQFVDNSLLEAIKLPLFNEKREVAAVIGIAKYISHRGMQNRQLYETNLLLQSYIDKYKASESALKHSEMSIQLSSTPFQWIDVNAKMYKVNQAACDILGYSEEELTSMTIHDIDPNYQKEKWVKSWDLWRNNQDLCFETIHIRKDGTSYPVEVSINFIVIDNQEFIFAYFNDISNRKKLEKDLQDERNNLANLVKQRTLELDNSLMELNEKNILLQNAIQHKNRFISSMSHELRTPLNAIIGFTQALEKQYFGVLNEKQLEYIKLVESSGQHLLSLINDILDSSKIDIGAIDFNSEMTNVDEVIKEVFSIMESQFKDKKINLSYKIDLESKILVVDIRKFKQILLNLLSNALKFTPVSGDVKIEVSKVAEYVKFSVIDNGYGIKDKDKAHIFEEFYQSEEVKERALGGAGIGLSLVKRLVEIHSGEIGIESEENKGSTFWFTIPITS